MSSFVAVSKAAVNRQKMKIKFIEKLNCEVRRRVTTLTAYKMMNVFFGVCSLKS